MEAGHFLPSFVFPVHNTPTLHTQPVAIPQGSQTMRTVRRVSALRKLLQMADDRCSCYGTLKLGFLSGILLLPDLGQWGIRSPELSMILAT